VEGLIVTINRVSPLILRKVGGLKPSFSGGLGPLLASPLKFPGGLSPPKPPRDLHPCPHPQRIFLFSRPTVLCKIGVALKRRRVA